MAFQVSPGINVSEIDLTASIPSVAVSTGAIAGAFKWGPANTVTQITSETDLVSKFGAPDNGTANVFFTAASFLAYSNDLYVVRAANASSSFNATANSNTATGNAAANTHIPNEAYYLNNQYNGTAEANTGFVARYPGDRGNSLTISICPANTAFSAWTYKGYFDTAPGTSTYVSGKNGANDEMHIVIVDAGGLFTGTPNTVLETYGYVSKASDARTDDGSTNYYRDVLYNKSKYVYWANHPANTTVTNWGSEALNTTFGNGAVYTQRFGRGADGTINAGALNGAYDLYEDSDNIDISLILAADGHDKGVTVVNNLTDIADSRKDCVVFISPTYEDTLIDTDPTASISDTARNALQRSSYTVHDSGWKQMYDKYNDRYRWVPLNGDIAGLCARTDRERDPWYSPAGFQRGAIKNVVKLAYNPNKTQRDTLYKAGVNPVVSLPGEGTLLFGDKTFANKPSAFDRINVRRLFIVLEKAISKAARASLFEFNDEFTRAQFVSLVEPFLRTVQGRRGIYDFRVVCDETNNTSDIIDRNEFVGDIYIKPARSINFVQLNFVAVRTGVEFNEIVGKF
jgi:hypothetical protein